MFKKALWLVITFFMLFFTACGGGGGGGSAAIGYTSLDEKYLLEYKGLTFFSKALPVSSYKLEPLSDSEFNELNMTEQIVVADKLLSSMFFGYNLNVLKEKIYTNTFLSDIQKSFQDENLTQREWIEEYITDEDKFVRYITTQQEATDILARFYAFKSMDSYFLHNWIAYILTQTIMFSPAYELDSSHNPDIARVYNRIVSLIDDEAGMRYITYIHMMSEDNWRRFRSPEDNAREMLEIFTLDFNDSHIPIAAKALQNWKLNTDNDTLVIGLNENTQPLKLFGTTIYNGDDFYRELVKSDAFIKGSVERLVRFFFEGSSEKKIMEIKNKIVQSKPERWQDIILQIVFSKEYLLNTQRAKSAEETFFSLAKKIDFLHQRRTIYIFKKALEDMHQASMKYKLGKLTRVPLDTLSFSVYHKTIREEMMLRHSKESSFYDYSKWTRQGWSDDFLDDSNYLHDASEPIKSLEAMIDYLFLSTISRVATDKEKEMFENHMCEIKDSKKSLIWEFDIFVDNKYRESYKRNVAYLVLDYISRLERLYMQVEVK